MTLFQMPAPAETIVLQLLPSPHCAAWPLFLHVPFLMPIVSVIPSPVLRLFGDRGNADIVFRTHWQTGSVSYFLLLLFSGYGEIPGSRTYNNQGRHISHRENLLPGS